MILETYQIAADRSKDYQKVSASYSKGTVSMAAEMASGAGTSKN